MTELSENILERINHGGTRADLERDIVQSDLDFGRAYKVYESSTLFEENTCDAVEIAQILEEGNYLWQLPVFADGTTLLVDLIKPEEPGQWTAGVIYVYKNRTVDYCENIENSLIRAGFDPDDYTYKFVSGLPGIRYPIAVVCDENYAKFIIPAEAASAHVFEGEWSTVNNGASPSEIPAPMTEDSFNVYAFEEIADASRRADAAGRGGEPGILPDDNGSSFPHGIVLLGIGIAGTGGIALYLKRKRKN